jgi:hypothetical protein
MWPQFSANTSMGLVITDTSSIGYVNYTQCDFWDKSDSAVANQLATFNATTGSTNASGTSASSPIKSSVGSVRRSSFQMVAAAGVIGLLLII